MSYSKEEVKENLDPEDIMTLLEYFNAEPEMFDNYIVAKTICHNEDPNEASRKLYYYYNSSLFQCYTNCGYFDIFELVQKVKHLENLNDAVYFVVNFLNLQSTLEEVDEQEYSEDWKIFARYEQELSTISQEKLVLPQIDIDLIKYYPQPRLFSWERDGISKEVCDFMDIHYDPIGGSILIPHFDEDNRCIGIRQRTLIQENEKWGKYMPWRDWKNRKKLYNHPLAFNLYGLNISKPRIQEMKIAIVFESEKSVLQYMTYFGTANCIAVAVCGSSLSKYQFNLLYSLGVNEIVIGFDKDFESIGSDDWQRVTTKLQKIYDKYNSMVNISFLFDKECNTLGYKESPTDAGKDKFLYLFRNRLIL